MVEHTDNDNIDQTAKAENPNSNVVKNNREKNSKSKKKFWVITSICVLTVLLGLGAWFLLTQNDIAEQKDYQQEKKEPSSVLSYQDCLEAEGSDVDEEGGTCITADGLIFTLGDDFSNEQAENVTESSSGDQSATLEIGPSTPAFLWGSPYLLSHVDSTLTLPVKVTTTNISLNACTLTVKSVPDKSENQPISYSKTPLTNQDITFIDGWHTVSLECKTNSGAPLKVVKEFGVADNKPERCADFVYNEPTDSSVDSVAGLRAALTGSWEGCVDLPFGGAPSPYYVAITFNSNGSYSALSSEVLDGETYGGGFYKFSAAGQQAGKIFGITSFENGMGAGYLDIIGTISPDEGRVIRSDIRNVKLNGDILSFDYHYRPQTSAIHFKLTRQ